MAQSDARFGYQAKMSRDSHDLSRQFGFTCAPGQMLPIFADFCSPGDSYYLTHDLTFLRTAPLASPAMVDVKVHFESFFVPFQMIYQPSENTLFNLNNIYSSNFDYSTFMNNNFPVFNYSAYCSDILTNHPTTSYRTDAFRLADMLRLNPENFITQYLDSNNDPINKKMGYAPGFFPWQILAYHTIWNYYFRLDDKSQFVNDFCNWDKYYATSSVTPTHITFMGIHQRPWNFDYFTSIYRSPIVSDANLQGVLNYGGYSDLVGSITAPRAGNGISTNTNSIKNAFGIDYSGAQSATENFKAFNTASIRQMFANEKLAMITGRTKKNYDSQVLAHYGVNVPHDVKHDITLIGADSYPLHIGEVTSLATTLPSGGNPGTALGELAGKGWAKADENNRKHKFTAPCHGVIMTLFSIEPIKRYYGGFDRINAVSNVFDLPTPEFDRMGNVPMYRYEVGEFDNSQNMYVSDIIGWKERYYQFKRRFNCTTLAFMAGYRFTGTNVYNSYMIATPPFGRNSPGSSYWLTARPDVESNFYIDAHSMDNLMLVDFQSSWLAGSIDDDEENWSVTPWNVYARDPFIVDTYEKVTKVSWMSKDGEPIYPY